MWGREAHGSGGPVTTSPHIYYTATQNLGLWVHNDVSPVTVSALSLLFMAVKAIRTILSLERW